MNVASSLKQGVLLTPYEHSATNMQHDHNLQCVINAWPRLSERVRKRILLLASEKNKTGICQVTDK